MPETFVELVSKMLNPKHVLPTRASARGVPALDDESRYAAVEGCVFVVPFLAELQEVLAGHECEAAEECAG